jgi:hypothetical protein
LYILLNPVITISNLVIFSQALLLGFIAVAVVDFCFYFSYWRKEKKLKDKDIFQYEKQTI